MVLRQAAPASSRNWLEMQILRPHPLPTELEVLEVGLEI